MNDSRLFALLQLSDPALPIGGFAHSSGLETYVQQGVVRCRGSAKSFIETFLRYSLHHTDAALASLAHDAARAGDLDELRELDAECDAAKPASETRSASRKLGVRLLKLFAPMCSHPLLDAIQCAIKEGTLQGHYSILFGAVAAVLDLPKRDALNAFYYNAASGLVTNSVKLVPLGQQEGQELLFGLHPLLSELAIQSLEPRRDLVGFSSAGSDIRCMQHEFLYSRLYMS